MAEHIQIRVALGILHRNRQVLLARRPHHVVLGGYWEFPGGKLLDGESAPDGVCRELREELGIDGVCCDELPPLEHTYDHGRVILFPVICRCDNGEPRPLASAEIRWVPLTELPVIRMPPANTALVVEVVKRLACDDGQ